MSRSYLLAALLLAAGCGPAAVKPDPLKEYKEQAKPAAKPKAKAEQDYWKGRSDLFTSPPVQPVHALKLPALTRTSLKNGLSVLLLPDRRLPLVDVQLAIRTGAIDDPADLPGLAEFTAEMLRQGTRRMSADKISETVDMAGAGLSADSDYEVTSVHCHARSQSLELCLRMVAELAMHPTFPKKEMNEIRDRLLSGVKNMRDDPATLASVHFDALLFGEDHPAGRVKSEASVRRIARRDLVRFHRELFRPDRAILGVSGDIDPAALAGAVQRVFGPWRAAGKPPTRSFEPVRDPPPGLKVLLVDKADLSQSFFTLGHAGIPRSAADRHAVSVMNYVLGGGGFSSRLMEVVRAKGGKTYGITSHFYRAQKDGSFVAQSFTRNDQLVAMLELVRKELGRIRERPPSEVELDAAKGKIAGGYPIRLKTAAALAWRLVSTQLWGLPETEVTEFPVLIEGLSREQIARAARDHIHPDRLVAAVVGKASVVAPLLRAAKIPFEQIDYRDPVSVREREALKKRAHVKVTPEQNRAAHRVLDRALQVAGGRARLSGIRSLRLTGDARVEAKGQALTGQFSAQILLPDHMRIGLALKAGIGMVQVLAGNKAWLQVGPQRKDLPAEVVTRWKAMIWREPALVLLHASAKGVDARVVSPPGLAKGQVAVEVYPPGLPPATLVIDKTSNRLVEVQHRDRTGQVRVSRLGKHKRIRGILVPQEVSASGDGRRQTVQYTKVELNPSITKQEITGGR